MISIGYFGGFMFRLLILILAFSCSTPKKSETERRPYRIDPKAIIGFLHTQKCTKAGACDQATLQRVADYICKERNYDEAHLFEFKTTPVNAKAGTVKVRICDFKENTQDLTKSRCEWSEQVVNAQTDVFSEIVCRRKIKHGQTIEKSFPY